MTWHAAPRWAQPSFTCTRVTRKAARPREPSTWPPSSKECARSIRSSSCASPAAAALPIRSMSAARCSSSVAPPSPTWPRSHSAPTTSSSRRRSTRPRRFAGSQRACTCTASSPSSRCSSPACSTFGRYLAEKGLIDGPWYVNVLLGNLGTSPATPGALASFLALLPQDSVFAVAGIGRFQTAANLLGIASGGHVRVGLEDNLWWDRDRTVLATNAQLVERVCRMADVAERPIATPAETRALLGLGRPASVAQVG